MNSYGKALIDFKELQANTRTPEGAEARYMVAQILQKTGNSDDAEKAILEYIKVSIPAYSVSCESFLLLATILKDKGDNFQAKHIYKAC